MFLSGFGKQFQSPSGATDNYTFEYSPPQQSFGSANVAPSNFWDQLKDQNDTYHEEKNHKASSVFSKAFEESLDDQMYVKPFKATRKASDRH